MSRGPFSGGDDSPWPGAWPWGVDFADAEKGSRVLAVGSAGGIHLLPADGEIDPKTQLLDAAEEDDL